MKRKDYITEQDNLRLLDDCYNKGINKIKLSIANTKAHEMKKCDICYELELIHHRFITEARFKYNKGRADVFDITDGIAYEVVCSEKEASLLSKKSRYPVPFEIIKVIK